MCLHCRRADGVARAPERRVREAGSLICPIHMAKLLGAPHARQFPDRPSARYFGFARWQCGRGESG
jgi:hypothetical protein